jgi:hypothetical protein
MIIMQVQNLRQNRQLERHWPELESYYHSRRGSSYQTRTISCTRSEHISLARWKQTQDGLSVDASPEVI